MASLSISLSGILDSQLRMAAVSHNVTQLNVEAPAVLNEVSSHSLPQASGVGTFIQTRESVFGVDLVSEAVQLKLAVHSLNANAAAIHAANDTFGTLLDILDTDQQKD